MALVCCHNAGFFSCCSVRLHTITNFINKNKLLPNLVDSSKQFSWYKKDKNKDITFEYFEHYDNISIGELVFKKIINYRNEYQYKRFYQLDFHNIQPIVTKYFSPSKTILDIITSLEQKYKLQYDSICVLFYRGNDKNRETKICGYDEYVAIANTILRKNPNIQFLIQSDETEFIELMINLFPGNSFYFKDEIRHMKKCNSTVDKILKNENYEFSKYYLGITIVMSKCKYIVCGSGNCSIWIMLYRGNAKQIYQNLNSFWIFPEGETIVSSSDVKKICDFKEDTKSLWTMIGWENDIIKGFEEGDILRYGFEGVGWVEKVCTDSMPFTASNNYFGKDPAPMIIKVVMRKNNMNGV